MPLSSSELAAARNIDLRPRATFAVWLSSLIAPIRLLLRRRKKRRSWEDGLNHELSQHVRAANWDEARRVALKLSSEAEKRQDLPIMNDAAWSLTRLGSYPRAFQLFAEYRRWVGGRDIPEWDGSDLAGRVLLIDSPSGDIARYMFWAPLLGEARLQAKRCIVLTEPRMVPLYRRTFPELDVRIELESSETRKEPDFVASFERLASYFWPRQPAQTIRLKPDPALVAEFRSRYQSLAPRPLIGIAWGSLNKNKDLPALRDWARLIGDTAGTFMSIQYGDVTSALSDFEKLVPGRVISDPSVNQLVDLDRFAAQLGALDAVVSISNTSAHLASSLGVPTIVVLDDKFHLMWPVGSDRTPWYTNTKMVRRNKRSWRNVMDTASGLLRELLDTAGGRTPLIANPTKEPDVHNHNCSTSQPAPKRAELI